MAAQKKIPLLQLYTDFGESENVSVQILINGENASEAIRELLGLASRIKDASDYREEEKVLAEKAPKKESESKSKKAAQANSAPSDSAPAAPAPASPTAGAPATMPVQTVSETPNDTAAAPQPETAPTILPASVPPTAAPIAPPQPAAPVPPQAPTAVPQYDFNKIASATMQLQQAGQNIFEIFQMFGIQSLNQLPQERYTEYAAELRRRGAKI